MTNEIFKKLLENMILTCYDYGELRAYIKGAIWGSKSETTNTTSILLDKVLSELNYLFELEFDAKLEQGNPDLKCFIKRYFRV